MTFPTIWASVLLDRLPTELASLAAACTRLGVDATPTREGWLALPGGFLAMLSPAPYPEDLLVHPGALEVPARAHTAVLHLSGGGDDAERVMHETITQDVREGRVPSKTTRFQKVERLVELVRALAPLGPGVVLPLASHRYVPAEAWPATEGAGETFGLFVTIGRAGDVLQTRGMSVFAVSECACATLDPAETAPRLFDVAFEVAWRGHTPREGGVFEAFVDREVPPCELTPVLPDLLWIGDPHDPAGAIALHDAAVRAQARTVFAAPALFDDPGASGDVASITMHGALEGPRRAMTVGLARLPRAEGPVELITTSRAQRACRLRARAGRGAPGGEPRRARPLPPRRHRDARSGGARWRGDLAVRAPSARRASDRVVGAPSDHPRGARGVSGRRARGVDGPRGGHERVRGAAGALVWRSLIVSVPCVCAGDDRSCGGRVTPSVISAGNASG